MILLKIGKKRLIIATDKSIFYFSDPVPPTGQIDFYSIFAVKEATDSSYFPNSLEIVTPERVWVFSFKNKQQQQAWKEFLDDIVNANIARKKQKKEAERMASAKRQRTKSLQTPPRNSTDLWAT